MIPKVEVFQAIRDWNAVPYVPISEAERKLRQTDCALTVGAYLVLNGAHTKEAFLTNFLEALGPTAEGFAKTAYTVNMATHGFGDNMESWDLPLEERKRRAEKMVFAEAAEQALRELKAEEEKRAVTAKILTPSSLLDRGASCMRNMDLFGKRLQDSKYENGELADLVSIT